jgi:hypothetical protein
MRMENTTKIGDDELSDDDADVEVGSVGTEAVDCGAEAVVGWGADIGCVFVGVGGAEHSWHHGPAERLELSGSSVTVQPETWNISNTSRGADTFNPHEHRFWLKLSAPRNIWYMSVT